MDKPIARLNVGLTDSGRAIVTGTVFIALAALIVPAFGVLSALVSVLAASLLVGLILRPKIEITGNLPDRLVKGRTVELKYTVRNIGRLPLYNLSVDSSTASQAIEQAADAQIIPYIGPEDSTELTITTRALRRGRWQIKSPACHSSFPFNLFKFAATAGDENTLIVLPPFSMIHTGLARWGRRTCAGSGTVAKRVGLSAEYAGNRPFLPGDSLRTIDARAWARLSTPVTREYHDDLDNSAALILDTAVADKILAQSESNEIREFEAAVSLCASVAFSINGDRLIDLLLAGDDLYEFTAQPRSLRLERAHDILAGLEPSTHHPSSHTSEILAGRFAEISEVFFILLGWNKNHRHLLELAENSGCQCTVFIVDDSDATTVYPSDIEHESDIHFVSPDDILTGKITHL